MKRGQVQLQADEEEKQEQANVGQRVEHGEALHREDVVEEGLVSAKRRRAEEDVALHALPSIDCSSEASTLQFHPALDAGGKQRASKAQLLATL